jgi:hypothetical protein
MVGNIIDKAFEFISGQENKKSGPDYNKKDKTFSAYWDVSRYSIGYGNLSYAAEVISEQEAENRCKSFISAMFKEMSKFYWFSVLSDNQKIAVMSYAYQYGVNGFQGTRVGRAIKESQSASVVEEIWRSSTMYTKRRIAEADLWATKNSSRLQFVALFIALLILFYHG